MKHFRIFLAYLLFLPFTTGLALAENKGVANSSCTESNDSELCKFGVGADELIGVENSGSLGRDPSTYFIMARYGDEWSVYARRVIRAPVHLGDDNWHTIETRVISRTIDSKRVSHIENMLSDQFVAELNATPYFPADLICLHGSTLHVMIKSVGKNTNVRRHSCSPRTKLDDLQDALRAIAFEADPAMAEFAEVRH